MVANNLADIMDRLGLTTSLLARYSEVSTSTISAVRNRRRNPTRPIQFRILKALISLSDPEDARNYTITDVFPDHSPNGDDRIHLEDVFKKSGPPTFTFVKPEEYERLLVAIRTPGRGLVVEGPSGIGKTTCVLKVLDELGERHRKRLLSARVPDEVNAIRQIGSGDELGIVVIDDFHCLDNQTKTHVAEILKILADKGEKSSKIVAVGINKVGSSLLSFAPDLAGRVDVVQFESNSPDRILELIRKGEDALRVQINVSKEIVDEARGSFHLAQTMCHEVCVEQGVTEEQPTRRLIQTSGQMMVNLVYRSLEGVFKKRSRKLASGPRMQRHGRAPYLHLLKWLSESRSEWSIDVEDLAQTDPHAGLAVEAILKNGELATFMANSDFSDLLFFDAQNCTISIEDPKYLFYLANTNWTHFAGKLGYTKVEFHHKYDVALSFAGSARGVAEKLFAALQERQLNVFYDRNEQSRIIGENIEDYLKPVYAWDSALVVPIVSEDYPERVWTAFESMYFGDEIGKGTVVPISLGRPTFTPFDESRKVGWIRIETDDSLVEESIANAAAALTDKVRALRETKTNR